MSNHSLQLPSEDARDLEAWGTQKWSFHSTRPVEPQKTASAPRPWQMLPRTGFGNFEYFQKNTMILGIVGRHRRTPNFSTIWQHIGVDQQNLNIGGCGRVFQLLLKTKNLSHHIAQWEGVADGRGRQSPSDCVFSGFCEPSRFLRNIARLARKPCTSSAACCATCN